MSNYSSLKATINANIKQNGNEEITGPILNSVLNAMVDSLAGYHYSGIATPATNPGTPDSNVFYLASEAGTYTNFGGLAVAEGEVAILKYNGTWTKEVTGAATASEVSQLGQEANDFSKEIGIPVDYRYPVTASGNLYCPYVGKAGDKLTIKLLADGVISPSADIPIYAQNGNNFLCNITPGGQHEVLLTMDITQFYIYLAASNFIAPGTITLSIVKTDSVIGEYLPMNYTGKILSRTANLFNYNDKLHYKQIINDSGVWSANSNLSTAAIPLEAGKTYYKYSQPGTKNSWGGMSTRIFDGNGNFVLSTTTDTITVPDNIVNPIGYFRYYHTGTGGDITKFMVLESGVDGSSYIPYYTATYEQSLLDYIKSLIKPTTGQGEDVTMSQKAITDALAGLVPEYRFAERPESGYENFLVSVDTAISNTSTTGQESADTPNIKQDRCIISIPESYSRNGEPTRLIIIGHGTGWTCTSATTQPMGIIYVPSLLNKGYAVLGWNGTPGDVDGLANGNNGTPQCYRSLLAAYKYVTEKYNIARDGVLTAGYSMGTLMTAQISCFTDIPVLAQVFFSAGFELMKGQFTLKPSVRQRMCQLFGFVGTAPTFTEQNPPSQAEKDYVLANFDKWAGFDPVINGFCGKAIETFAVWPASSTASDADEAALYEDKAIVRRVPTKFIYCADDTTASPRWSKYVAKMMRNAGCYVEVREYATGGHNSINAGTYTSGIPGAQYEAIVFLERFNH